MQATRVTPAYSMAWPKCSTRPPSMKLCTALIRAYSTALVSISPLQARTIGSRCQKPMLKCSTRRRFCDPPASAAAISRATSRVTTVISTSTSEYTPSKTMAKERDSRPNTIPSAATSRVTPMETASTVCSLGPAWTCGGGSGDDDMASRLTRQRRSAHAARPGSPHREAPESPRRKQAWGSRSGNRPRPATRANRSGFFGRLEELFVGGLGIGGIHQRRPPAHVDRHAQHLAELLRCGAQAHQRLGVEAEAAVAAVGHADGHGDQFLGLLVQRAGRHRRLGQRAKAL